MRCSRCGHIDNRPDIFYCPRCSSSLGRGVGLLPAATSQSSQLAPQSVSQQTALAARQAYEVSSYPVAIQRVYWDRYQAEEALNRDNPFWELFLKHFKAFEALQEAKKYIPIQQELQKQAYVRSQQLVIDGELARRTAEQRDAIAREQVLRRSMMLAEAIEQITELFTNGPMAALPDEIKAELINRFIQQTEQWIFRADTPPSPNPQPRTSNGGIVIDADEF